MRTFIDEQLRTWKLNLTWDKADEIAARCERPDSTPEHRKTFDLFNMTDKEQTEYFDFLDPATGRFNRKNAAALAYMIYVLCEGQCQERGVSAEEFCGMMQTGIFGRAMDALIEELVNFIPDQESKKMFQTMLSLVGGSRKAASSKVTQNLIEKQTVIDAQITQILDEEIDKAFSPMTQALAKVAEEFGTTNSSKSAESSVSSPII